MSYESFDPLFDSLGFDHYKVMGVEHTATTEQIQSIYKKLALKTHPDKNPDDANATFKMARLNEAHEILTDPSRRSSFDESFGYTKRPGQPAPRPTGPHVDDDDSDDSGEEEIWACNWKRDKRGRVKQRRHKKMRKNETEWWTSYALDRKQFKVRNFHDYDDVKPVSPDSLVDMEEDEPSDDFPLETPITAADAAMPVDMNTQAFEELFSMDTATPSIESTKMSSRNKTFKCKGLPKKPKYVKTPAVDRVEPINPIRIMERHRGGFRNRGWLDSHAAYDLEMRLAEANQSAWEAHVALVNLINFKRQVDLAKRTKPLKRKLDVYKAIGRAGAVLNHESWAHFGDVVDEKKRAYRLKTAKAEARRLSGKSSLPEGQQGLVAIADKERNALSRWQRIDTDIAAAKKESEQRRLEVRKVTRDMAKLWTEEAKWQIKEQIMTAIEAELVEFEQKYRDKIRKLDNVRPAEKNIVRGLEKRVHYLRRALDTRANHAEALAEAGADEYAIDRCRKGRGQYQAFVRDEELFEYLSYEQVDTLEKMWERQAAGATFFHPATTWRGGNMHNGSRVTFKGVCQQYVEDDSCEVEVLGMMKMPFEKSLLGDHTYSLEAARFQDECLAEALWARKEAEEGLIPQDPVLGVELGDCKHSG
ncbi:Chaperone protein dnaJ 3 [Pestalotiopsis sp. 9143b]|nr:Chaperone protein dnaJ 3 [Pestalotiopsis sp. 9143b]